MTLGSNRKEKTMPNKSTKIPANVVGVALIAFGILVALVHNNSDTGYASVYALELSSYRVN